MKNYVDWNTPGQNIQGTLLSYEIGDYPYPSTVRLSMRLEDGTVAFFFAPTNLKGKITHDDVGKFVDILYLGKRQSRRTDHESKNFRVMREVEYQQPVRKYRVKKWEK